MLLRIGLIQVKLQVQLLEANPLPEYPSTAQGSPLRMEASLAEHKDRVFRTATLLVPQR